MLPWTNIIKNIWEPLPYNYINGITKKLSIKPTHMKKSYIYIYCLISVYTSTIIYMNK